MVGVSGLRRAQAQAAAVDPRHRRGSRGVLVEALLDQGNDCRRAVGHPLLPAIGINARHQFRWEPDSRDDFLAELFAVFYQVGLVGVKLEPHLSRQWSHLDEPLLSKGQIRPSSMIDTHKTFWGALGISKKDR